MEDKQILVYIENFEEMISQIEETIQNVSNLICDHYKLTDLIDLHGKEDLTNLSKELKESIKQYESQVEKLKTKLEKMKQFVALLKSSEENQKFALIMIEAFGLFQC